MLLLIALLACGDKDDGPAVTDADNDGFETPEDCDDNDVSVHPDAVEWCNGIDDDCDGEIDDAPADGDVWHEDIDGDGYGDPLAIWVACDQPDNYVLDSEDCDDDAPTVYPGAPELCDDLDNDCDSDVDEDPTDAPTWYLDADEDGVGSADNALDACNQPDGYVDASGDCRDDDATVFPGADETCNEIDDDCDDEVDEEPIDGDTFYNDGDSDGYGDASTPQVACEAPADTIDQGDDCDDGDRDRYPGAPEICGDGMVNDCDGTPDSAAATCGGWGDPVDADASFHTLFGASGEDYHGSTLAAGQDIDGNGFPDLLVGGFQNSIAGEGAGRVTIVRYLSAEGSAIADTLYGVAGMELGSEVELLGDVGTDGMSEWLVAATMAGDGEQGRVYVMPGTTDTLPQLSDAVAIWEGSDDEIAGTEALAALGDVDDDGVIDFAVGARYGSFGGTYAGHAYVVSGGATGESDLSDATATLYASTDYAFAGSRVEGPGDLDGDGVNDIVVDGHGDAAAWILTGPVTGDVDLEADADVSVLDGEGLSLTDVVGGDIDGDGTADLVISSIFEATSGDNAGGVFVHLGPFDADVELTDAAVSVLGSAEDLFLGGEVALLDDMDGDDKVDLLVGTGSSQIRADSISVLGEGGTAMVFSGLADLTGTLSDADADHFIESSLASFGADLASAGDVDDDGLSDVLIAAPQGEFAGSIGWSIVVTADIRY